RNFAYNLRQRISDFREIFIVERPASEKPSEHNESNERELSPDEAAGNSAMRLVRFLGSESDRLDHDQPPEAVRDRIENRLPALLGQNWGFPNAFPRKVCC